MTELHGKKRLESMAVSVIHDPCNRLQLAHINPFQDRMLKTQITVCWTVGAGLSRLVVENLFAERLVYAIPSAGS